MRKIQSKILPNDWLKKVKDFDIDNSSLSNSQKSISKCIKKYILLKKSESLSDLLSQIFIKHIIFGKEFLLYYDDLPINLIENAMEELKGIEGLEFSKKLHSIFIEFMIYKDFVQKGYKLVEFQRCDGSCDLVMCRNGVKFNIEIKFKENNDISTSKIFDIIDGYSLLPQNEFLRGVTLEINWKVDYIYKNKDSILSEINEFINDKNDVFDGNYIQIFNTKNRHKLNRNINSLIDYSNNFIISNEFEDKCLTKAMIKNLFCGKDRHITNLIKKSEKYDNFVGCLSWSVPFHKSIDFNVIESSFRELFDLEFDLHIYVNHIHGGESHFVLKKNRNH